MNITIIGTGFVGVVSAAVYASLGNTVIGLDIDQRKIDSLKQGKVPFYEPDLEKLLLDQQAGGNLTFTTDYQTAISDADVIIIAVGTPSNEKGEADLRFVFAATESLAPHLKENAIVVVKSTVPPGTLTQVESIISKLTQTKFHLASMPEFLREGKAVHDTLHPDRIVIGATDSFTFEQLEQIHRPLTDNIIKVKPESAQMGKYAANAYLATRITFINQVADLCERNGADIEEVIKVISPDQRIGPHYWYPGFGYGGSCFPKDVNELAAYSRLLNLESNFFNQLSRLNTERIPMLMDEYAEKMGGWEGKTVAILGLSFKPHTNDMREAPSIKVIEYLKSKDVTIKGYDPKAIPDADYFIPPFEALSYHQTIEKAIENADVIMALIEWPEIVTFDFAQNRENKQQWFIDARNQFNPHQMEAAGYIYMGVGR
ncbi:MAG TPA: UDP-glucose/GDP-mannose dehydrogenase family protein [Patescibacteria group bacterium]